MGWPTFFGVIGRKSSEKHLGMVRLRSFCMVTFMKFVMLITILKMLKIFSMTFHLSLSLSFRCLCVHMCLTSMWHNTHVGYGFHYYNDSAHTLYVYSIPISFIKIFYHNKHAYHIWNNIINCFTDKIEVWAEFNMVRI